MNDFSFYQKTFSDVFLSLWERVFSLLPSFILAIVLLFVGYYISKISARMFLSVASRLNINGIGDVSGFNSVLEKSGLNISLAKLLSLLLQAFIGIGFILSVSEILGLNQLSQAISKFLFFLPKILASIAILMVGFWVSQVVYRGTRESARSLGVDSSQAIAALVKSAVVLISFSLAVAQLEVDVSLLNMLVIGILIAIVVAISLSLGLGTRDFSKEIVAGVYVKDLYSIGDEIKIGDVFGTVVSIESVCTVIETSKESIIIPNTHLLSGPVSRKLD